MRQQCRASSRFPTQNSDETLLFQYRTILMHHLRALLFGAPLIANKYTGPITQTAVESQRTLGTMSSSSTEKATFAAGCFWGVEHIYRKHFDHKGLIDAKVGYIGGKSSSPTYRDVCSGTTNHAEAVQLDFDPTKVSYAELVDFFYRMHDPTQVDRQGPDHGTQYRSAIFTHSPEQAEIAKKVTADCQVHFKSKIATKIQEAGQWWDAEDYHQRYLEKNRDGYECPTHFLRTW